MLKLGATIGGAMPREIDLLANTRLRYARTVELNVTAEAKGFRYSIEPVMTPLCPDGEFEVVAVCATSASDTNVLVSFDTPHLVYGYHVFGSPRLTSSLRGQSQPVKYITIRSSELHAVSYNAPKKRLEWEGAVVEAYSETGSKLALVGRVIGWLQQDGQIFLADPPQVACA